jgi:hypothetical protein
VNTRIIQLRDNIIPPDVQCGVSAGDPDRMHPIAGDVSFLWIHDNPDGASQVVCASCTRGMVLDHLLDGMIEIGNGADVKGHVVTAAANPPEVVVQAPPPPMFGLVTQQQTGMWECTCGSSTDWEVCNQDGKVIFPEPGLPSGWHRCDNCGRVCEDTGGLVIDIETSRITARG